MAFSLANLTRECFANNGGSIWYYETADTLATVLAANYFNSAANKFQAGDIIDIVADGALYSINVSTNNGTTVALAVNPALFVGNAATGNTLGTVTHKIEVFNAAGVSVGFVPVYDAITTV